MIFLLHWLIGNDFRLDKGMPKLNVSELVMNKECWAINKKHTVVQCGISWVTHYTWCMYTEVFHT